MSSSRRRPGRFRDDLGPDLLADGLLASSPPGFFKTRNGRFAKALLPVHDVRAIDVHRRSDVLLAQSVGPPTKTRDPELMNQPMVFRPIAKYDTHRWLLAEHSQRIEEFVTD